MADPFVGEIRIFAGNFPPNGWAFCNGQLLPISQNTALFSLLGTNFGGNGLSTFALPNLQGCAPMQPGQGPGLTDRALGESGGSATVTLQESEIPSHTHSLQASDRDGRFTTPESNFLASGETMFNAAPPDTSLSPSALGAAGGSLPHNNRSPYLALTFIIALQGIFPPRS